MTVKDRVLDWIWYCVCRTFVFVDRDYRQKFKTFLQFVTVDWAIRERGVPWNTIFHQLEPSFRNAKLVWSACWRKRGLQMEVVSFNFKSP